MPHLQLLYVLNAVGFSEYSLILYVIYSQTKQLQVMASNTVQSQLYIANISNNAWGNFFNC